MAGITRVALDHGKVHLIKVVRMIVNRWGPTFTRLYGHRWPLSYCAIDTEYTGGNEDKDLIVEIGHTLVRDGTVVDRLSLVLDWSNHPVVPDDWVRGALDRIALRMLQKGSKWRFTYDTMRKEGIKPERALAFYWKLFETVREQGIPFAAHNGYYADERLLAGVFKGFLGKRFSFGENNLFDTGAIEKATLCIEHPDRNISGDPSVWLPRADDSMGTYFCRIATTPVKGVLWNLKKCVEKYRLAEEHGLDVSQHHTAGYDSFCVHLLMEVFRAQIKERDDPEIEGPFDTQEAMERTFNEELTKEARKKDPQAQPDPPRRVRGQRKV